MESLVIEAGTFSLEDHYFYHQDLVFSAFFLYGNLIFVVDLFLFSSPGEPLHKNVFNE